jgi:hypothetical protein
MQRSNIAGETVIYVWGREGFEATRVCVADLVRSCGFPEEVFEVGAGFCYLMMENE